MLGAQRTRPYYCFTPFGGHCKCLTLTVPSSWYLRLKTPTGQDAVTNASDRLDHICGMNCHLSDISGVKLLFLAKGRIPPAALSKIAQLSSGPGQCPKSDQNCRAIALEDHERSNLLVKDPPKSCDAGFEATALARHVALVFYKNQFVGFESTPFGFADKAFDDLGRKVRCSRQ